LLDRFDELCKRIGQLLVGEYSNEVEEELFELLLFAERGMYLNSSDGMGSSLSTTFRVDLNDENCKPVCHTLRRYNRVKLEFIDSEV